MLRPAEDLSLDAESNPIHGKDTVWAGLKDVLGYLLYSLNDYAQRTACVFLPQCSAQSVM